MIICSITLPHFCHRVCKILNKVKLRKVCSFAMPSCCYVCWTWCLGGVACQAVNELKYHRHSHEITPELLRGGRGAARGNHQRTFREGGEMHGGTIRKHLGREEYCSEDNLVRQGNCSGEPSENRESGKLFGGTIT